MQHIYTQSEPAYCGVATLVMILNAFRVDPATVASTITKKKRRTPSTSAMTPTLTVMMMTIITAMTLRV